VLTPISDPEAGLPNNRFNDGKVDSRGRLWGGTMSIDAGTVSGALYMFGPGGSWVCRDRGFHVSNGLDWSPDDRTMYFCDTNAGVIYAYDFDVETGEIANRRPFVREPAERGKPDGLTVDVEGMIWCAFWDGWCVRRYDPQGRLVETLELPVPRPSSCCFGGPDMETLYITTARIRLTEAALSEAPLSGHLLAYRPGVRGRKTTRYKLQEQDA
jgi:sugar lactone lactonase YvrE